MAAYRGRFAPSPTGPLHFGSLVAAVGSYLDARSQGGEWLLRMEDVDAPRNVPGAAESILATLEACGFEWDGPVLWQGGRLPAYAAALEALKAKGARLQRPLWASTSTKNPDYPDTLYVDNLIGPNTVNTTPPKTLEAFMDHGKVANTLESNIEEAHAQLEQLSQLGINLDAITGQLLEEGVRKFEDSYDKLIEAITQKQNEFSIV